MVYVLLRPPDAGEAFFRERGCACSEQMIQYRYPIHTAPTSTNRGTPQLDSADPRLPRRSLTTYECNSDISDARESQVATHIGN